MTRRKIAGQLGKIASGEPRQQKPPTPTAKGDAALVNRSIQTTRARWLELKRYALDNDLKMYEAVERALASFLDK